jgi:putative component of toxin-antitoxin plasmid stabilization module
MTTLKVRQTEDPRYGGLLVLLAGGSKRTQRWDIEKAKAITVDLREDP